MAKDAASSAAGCVILIRMSELDERGILVNCPNCGHRNRMKYEGLGTVSDAANVNLNSSLLAKLSIFTMTSHLRRS